ncbi:hypothetical protein CRYUN_Cryun11dG0057700 [Craigia yunnanensis]
MGMLLNNWFFMILLLKVLLQLILPFLDLFSADLLQVQDFHHQEYCHQSVLSLSSVLIVLNGGLYQQRKNISQDGSRLWAIDKPNIAQPPPGWQRLLRIRGEGSTKFADIYYQAPSGKRLRSVVEVQKYLIEHPEYATEGVSLSRFSFQIPKPLQEDYVRKRPARITASHDNARPLEPGEDVAVCNKFNKAQLLFDTSGILHSLEHLLL